MKSSTNFSEAAKVWLVRSKGYYKMTSNWYLSDPDERKEKELGFN